MIDAMQILIAVVLSSLTVVLVIIGIEFFLILKEMRQSIIKMNKIIDDTGKVTGTIADTSEEISGFVSGVKKGAGLIGILSRVLKKVNEEKD